MRVWFPRSSGKKTWTSAIPKPKSKNMQRNIGIASMAPVQDQRLGIISPHRLISSNEKSPIKVQSCDDTLRKMGFTSSASCHPKPFCRRLLHASRQSNLGSLRSTPNSIASTHFSTSLLATTYPQPLFAQSPLDFEMRCVSWSEFPAIIPGDSEAVVHGMMVFDMPES